MQRGILQETRQSVLNIQHQMKDMLRQAEDWKNDEITKLNDLKSNHSTNLDKIEIQIQSINTKIEHVKEKQEIIQSEQQKEKQTEEKLQETLSSLKESTKSLPLQTKPIEEQIQQWSQQLEEKQKQFEQRQVDRQRELEQSSKGLPSFVTHTGMDIEMKEIDGRRYAQVAFTRIERSNPERRFSFCIRVKGNKQYEIEECEPPVEAQDALQHLNKTNNFQCFVVQMRALFHQYVEQHA